MSKQHRSSRSNRQAGRSYSTKGTSSQSHQPTPVASLSSPASTDVRSTGSRPLTTDDIPAIVQQITTTFSAEHPSPSVLPTMSTIANLTTSTTSQITSSKESTAPPLVDTPLIVNAVVSQLAGEGTGKQSGSSTNQAGHHSPTLKLLRNILKPDTSGLAARWHDLGTQLLTGDTVGTLDVIKANHPNDVSACCNKMFVMWLELQPNATWNQLIIALNMIGMNVQAEKVIKYLATDEKNTDSVKKGKNTALQSSNTTASTPEQASSEFGFLFAKIIKELSGKDEAENLESFKVACSFLTVKGDPCTLLFNEEQQEAINACSKIGTLLTKHLRHCWRWDDVSFLKRVFQSLDTEDLSERCIQMISQYEMKIYSEMKLKEIHEYCRQENVVLPEGYHKMVAIVKTKSFFNITLQEYKQLKEFISQHCDVEPYVISPFTEASVGSLLLEWLIPLPAVPHMIKMATMNTDIFIADAFVFLKISSTVIFDQRDNDKTTPLHCAANQGHLPVVETMIRSNADINTVTEMSKETASAPRVTSIQRRKVSLRRYDGGDSGYLSTLGSGYPSTPVMLGRRISRVDQPRDCETLKGVLVGSSKQEVSKKAEQIINKFENVRMDSIESINTQPPLPVEQTGEENSIKYIVPEAQPVMPLMIGLQHQFSEFPLDQTALTPGQDGYYLEDRDYNVEHLAWAGGSTSCNLGKDKVKNSKFVIKRPKKSFSEEEKQDVMRESRLLKEIDHDNIIRFYGLVEDLRDHCFKIFLEFADETCGDIHYLFCLSDDKENFSANIALIMLYVQQILLAVDYLHRETEILHLDIKGKNIVVCNGGYRVKLIDFSTACKVNGAQTKKHGWTPVFAAPEVNNQSDTPSFSADIWSVMCVAVEMVTGALPWPKVATMAEAAVFKVGFYEDHQITELVEYDEYHEKYNYHLDHYDMYQELVFMWQLVFRRDSSSRPATKQLLSLKWMKEMELNGESILYDLVSGGEQSCVEESFPVDSETVGIQINYPPIDNFSPGYINDSLSAHSFTRPSQGYAPSGRHSPVGSDSEPLPYDDCNSSFNSRYLPELHYILSRSSSLPAYLEQVNGKQRKSLCYIGKSKSEPINILNASDMMDIINKANIKRIDSLTHNYVMEGPKTDSPVNSPRVEQKVLQSLVPGALKDITPQPQQRLSYNMESLGHLDAGLGDSFQDRCHSTSLDQATHNSSSRLSLLDRDEHKPDGCSEPSEATPHTLQLSSPYRTDKDDKV